MKVASLTIPRARAVAFSSGAPQFADVRVRRAMRMAIDRQGIATAVLRHPGSTATQLLPAAIPQSHDTGLALYASDYNGANALLDQAGWVRDASVEASVGQFVFWCNAVALSLFAFSIPVIRNAVVEVRSDFFMTDARVKGLSATAVCRHHRARNAALPVVTYTALKFAFVHAFADDVTHLAEA